MVKPELQAFTPTFEGATFAVQVEPYQRMSHEEIIQRMVASTDLSWDNQTIAKISKRT
jgi:hypothetical protein